MYPIKIVLLTVLLTLIAACGTTYTTPAGGVNLVGINDVKIADLMSREPAADFPARVAVIRLQASNYSTLSNTSYGHGQYSIVSTRDIESDDSFAQMLNWEQLDSIAPVGRLLLPSELQSLQEIRQAAARLKADLVLAYTVDTSFHVEGKPLGPLSLISLGFLSNNKAHITSTVSGAVIDVRTGFVYGIAEASEKLSQKSTLWNTEGVIEAARLSTETSGFASFMLEAEKLWINIIRQYAD